MKSLHSYSIGFALSILLTLFAPALLWLHGYTHHTFPSHELMIVVFVLLAVAQLLVQLSFFLHIDQETKPRWNLMTLLFALLIVSIVVGGTLWIMDHLSHMQMTPEQTFESEAIAPEHTH